MEGQVREGLGRGEGDFARAGKGEGLEVGADRQVVVRRAVEGVAVGRSEVSGLWGGGSAGRDEVAYRTSVLRRASSCSWAGVADDMCAV